MSGKVFISRALFDHECFAGEPLTEREAWVWLIMEASWKGRTKNVGGNPVSLERGQLVASVRFMGDAWGWSKSRVSRFLERLKKWDMIGTASGTGILVITICNYEEYQAAPKASGTGAGQQAGQERDRSGTNYNKVNKDNKVKTPQTPLKYLAAVASEKAAAEFIEHRRQMKKPMTELAAEKMAKRLGAHPDPDAVLAYSIENGWQGVFPEKVESSKGGADFGAFGKGEVVR